MNKSSNICLWLLLCLPIWLYGQATVQFSGKVLDQKGNAISELSIIDDQDNITFTNLSGYFSIGVPAQQPQQFLFKSLTTEDYILDILLEKDTFMLIELTTTSISLDAVVVESQEDAFGIRQLRSVENGGIYEAKKSEVVSIENLLGNKAANNARQALGKIPSLNIWESDQAGLQLDIGGRGLSPKRTSNFNTRQNGYDIGADPLGYPESYYTPPLQAVQQIEIVRGAGALQYGSQFGGLINFKMKKGNSAGPIQYDGSLTYGSFDFINTYNALHGQVGKLNYYTYFQYKQGNGFRSNSKFDQIGAGAFLNYQFNSKFRVGLDYTHMKYLSQQPGGLTDDQFTSDPEQSNRQRNWFSVDWNLLSLSLDYELSEKSKIINKTFLLNAQRTSLGLLETPDLDDPLSNRDLLSGQFNNIGNETRWIFSYPSVDDLNNTLLLGARFYRGTTNFSQYFGSLGSDADFIRVDTAFLERRKSDFEFPNRNFAFFGEKIIRLSKLFSLVPGFRYEYIDTKSEGFYTTSVRINSFGDFIEQFNNDTLENARNVFLYGLGISYKWHKNYELYANATANYRAINFTDVQIQTNTQVVDSSITDEQGYSFDIGLRRRNFDPFYIEASLFYILYDDRIGEVIDDGLRVRTNVGAARIVGAEIFTECNLTRLFNGNKNHIITLFFNGSANYGVYTDINERALVGVTSGNRLEELPAYNIRLGGAYGFKKFKASLQASFIGKQFSDAANTEDPFVGVWGPIPAYQVVDFSLQYKISKQWSISSSINNLFNASYFTRRALAYPGPGIIPAQPRLWNVTLAWKL